MIHMPATLGAGDLQLGPATMAHFEAFADFLASDHAAFIGGPGDRREAWDSVLGHAGHWALRGFGTYWLERDGRPAGRVGVWHPLWMDEPELTWVIYAPFAGQGLGVRAAERVLDAWGVAGGTALMSLIDIMNLPSVAVARHLGARPEGEHRYDTGRSVTRWRHRHVGGAA